MDMCPEFERHEREFQGEGDELEVYAGTTKLDPKLAVKIYRRPAAGREAPLPEDVRPPAVLKRTLDYLLHTLLPADPSSNRFAYLQGFVWNRTRAIRQDFIVQGEAGPLTIECHERIARWHILSLHWRGGSVDQKGKPRENVLGDRDPWSEQQELEQLAKTLTSLNEFYDDLRLATGQAAPSPNEAEFRAYHLILNLYDPEVLRSVELLPEQIFDAPVLQAAIRLRAYAQRSNRGGSSRANALNTDAPQNFFSRFFAEVRSDKVPYLLAAMLENKFADVREGSLKALSSNYNKAHRGPPLAFVQEALGADSEEEVLEWAEVLGVEMKVDNETSPLPIRCLRLNTQVQLANKSLPSSFSVSLVEPKRGSFTLQQIIDGVASGAAPLMRTEASRQAGKAQTTKRPPAIEAPATSATRGFGPSILVQPSQPQPATIQPLVKSSHFSFSAASSAAAPTPPAAPPVLGNSGFFSDSPSSQEAGSRNSAQAAVFKPQQVNKPLVQQPPIFGSEVQKGQSSQTVSSFGKAQSKAVAEPAPRLSGFSFGPAPSKEHAAARVGFQSSFSAPPPIEAHNHAFAPQTKRPAAQIDAATSSSLAAPKDRALMTATSVTKGPTQSQLAASKIKQNRQRAAVQHVFDDLVQEYAKGVSQEALKKHMRSHRKAARAEILSSIAQRLLADLTKQAMTDIVDSVSLPALAQEYHRRKALQRSLELWDVRLGQRLEQSRREQRLEEVRSRVQERGLMPESRKRHRHDSTLNHSQSVRTVGETNEDDLLRSSFSQTKLESEDLWQQGTFLTAIASRVLHLTSRFRLVGLRTFDVLVDLPTSNGAEQEEAASVWLRHKFGFVNGQTDKTIPIAPDVEVRAHQLQPGDEDEHMGEVDGDRSSDEVSTGLVVFVLSSFLERVDSSSGSSNVNEMWEREKERLSRLSAMTSVTSSRLAPRLLVIHWSSSHLRSFLLGQLGLGDRKKQDCWSSIGVIAFDGRATGAPALKGVFSRGVEEALKDIALNQQPQITSTSSAARISVSQWSEPLRSAWTQVVSQAQMVFDQAVMHFESEAEMAGLFQHGQAGGREVTEAMAETFLAVIALANYSLRWVVDNSESILDAEMGEQEEDGWLEQQVYLPQLELSDVMCQLEASSAKLGSLSPRTALAQLGQFLLSKLEEQYQDPSGMDPTMTRLDLVRSQFAQASRSTAAFPFDSVLASLYTERIALLDSTRQPCTPAARTMLQEGAKIEAWGQEASNRLIEVVHRATRTQRELAKEERRKTTQQQKAPSVISIGSSSEGENGMDVDSPAEVAVADEGEDVQRLKRMIARAKQLLTHPHGVANEAEGDSGGGGSGGETPQRRWHREVVY